MDTGVYKIENAINHKIYIGSTAIMGFKKRWWSHRKDLRDCKHANQHLQNAWNKYGEKSFHFSILENCEPEHCIAREQYYFDTLHPEYNILQTAGSCQGYRHTNATKALIGAASSGKNHPMYSGEHVFYNPDYGFFTGGLFDFNRKFGFSNNIAHKLKSGTLDKSHGWIYIGKYPCNVPQNIQSFYHTRINNSRQIYTFYHLQKGIFKGTIPEFINRHNIKNTDRSTIDRLVNGKRKMAWGWIFLGEGNIVIPINVEQTYESAMATNSRANSRMNMIYTFMNKWTGETFEGTPLEIINKHQLNANVFKEVLGGRKRHLKGWTIKTC